MWDDCGELNGAITLHSSVASMCVISSVFLAANYSYIQVYTRLWLYTL